MSVRIRKVIVQDAEQIASIGIKTWNTSYRGIFPKEKLDNMSLKEATVNWTKIITDESRNPDLETFIVEISDDKIIGYAGGGKFDKTTLCDCEIGRIYIQEEYQNKGYGTMLFNKMLDFFHTRNWKTMIIWTLEDSAYRRFYEKMKGVPREKTIYTKWGKQYDLLGYVWENISILQKKLQYLNY